ncbi:VWA domain-containing protein, partial [Candidatus Bipolaricaulota bacterium]|nr:VWA domain-containing protein [Candidatus Bipolaricaulota bacterium]
VAVVVLALADPRVGTHRIDRNALILVDRSASMEATQSALDLHAILGEISAALPEWHLSVIEFASRAHVASPFGTTPSLSPSIPFAASSTKLEPAIDLALASLPSTGENHIILVSDGRFTDGIGSAVATAQAAGIPVSVFPAAHDVPTDVALAALRAPIEVQVGRTFEIAAEIEAQEPGEATLALYRDEELVRAELVDLQEGTNLHSIQDSLSDAGVYTYRALIKRVGDPIPQNDALSVLVRTTEQAHLLLVDRTDQPAIADMLDALGVTYDKELAIPPMEILSDYRQMILAGFPLSDLTSTDSARIETFVQELGGGLLLIGGEDDVRGYSAGDISDILPVSFVLPEKGQEASLAILFLLDRSASMQASDSGRVKIETLKEAAAASIALLPPDTLAGVIVFNRGFDWIAPIGPVEDGTALYEALRPLEAVGGTDIFFPIVEALDGLANVEARSKHILLISDGKTTDEPRDYPSLYRRLEETQDVTLTAIAIGELPNMPLLSSLVRAGHGALYQATNFASLPQVSIQATQRISRSRFVTGSTKVAGQLQALFPDTPIPPVGGYVVTYPKATAQILLWANEDPLAAHWRTGLGAVTVLNTDLEGRWSESWLEWPHVAGLLEVLLATTEPFTHSEIGLSVSIEQGEQTVAVLAEADNDGEFANFLEISADLLPLAMREPMEQVGPGAYRVTFPRPSEGGYAVRVTDSTRDRSVITSLSVAYPAEYRRVGQDPATLALIAQSTGGSVLDETITLPEPVRASTAASYPIFRELLLAALALFLLDLALRKRPRRSTARPPRSAA